MAENQKITHIAFIMDGNRRWAVAQGLPKMEGHTKGLENFKTIVEECSKLNIPNITFWALSTDNLKKREPGEIAHLFGLLQDIQRYLRDFISHGARINYIGDLTKLPSPLRVVLSDVARKTQDQTRMVVTLGINYGGHDEILRMCKEMMKQSSESSQVTEKSITS